MRISHLRPPIFFIKGLFGNLILCSLFRREDFGSSNLLVREFKVAALGGGSYSRIYLPVAERWYVPPSLLGEQS